VLPPPNCDGGTNPMDVFGFDPIQHTSEAGLRRELTPRR
jgi:hypothetical protein